MQRIKETGDGSFAPGNPETGEKGDKVTSSWLTSVQEEICGVIEGAGLVLDPENRGQLLAAIKKIPTYFLQLRDASAGQVYVDVPAADDIEAVPVIVGKLDDSDNVVTMRPAAGTVVGLESWDITVQGVSIMFVPHAASNNYVKVG